MKRTRRLSEEQQKLLERLAREQYALFMNTAVKLLGNTAAAEDAVQGAFLLAAEHIERLEELRHEQQTAYLVRVVKNNALRLLQRAAREEPWEEDSLEALVDTGTVQPESVCSRRELSEELQRALLLLNRTYRKVIRLYYFHQCSLDEIGLLLGESRETVRTQLRRGEKQLRLQAAVSDSACGRRTGRACRSLGCISPLSVVQYPR